MNAIVPASPRQLHLGFSRHEHGDTRSISEFSIGSDEIDLESGQQSVAAPPPPTKKGLSASLNVRNALIGALLLFSGSSVRELLNTTVVLRSINRNSRVPMLHPNSPPPAPAILPQPVGPPPEKILTKSGLYNAEARIVTNVEQAESYLLQSRNAVKAFDRLREQAIPVNVTYVYRYASQPETGNLSYITWDPLAMLNSLTPSHDLNSHACGTSSAASALLHETHHLLWNRDKPLGSSTLAELTHPFFDNYEEGRVVSQLNIVAPELGEAQRGTHHGSLSSAANATDSGGGKCRPPEVPSEAPRVVNFFGFGDEQKAGFLNANTAAKAHAIQRLSAYLTPDTQAELSQLFKQRAEVINRTFDVVYSNGTSVDIPTLWNGNMDSFISFLDKLLPTP